MRLGWSGVRAVACSPDTTPTTTYETRRVQHFGYNVCGRCFLTEKLMKI